MPGVPGIGVKTAAELINEYGDLDTLLERAAEIKQAKRRERLQEFALQARLSRELVRLSQAMQEAGADTPAAVEAFLQASPCIDGAAAEALRAQAAMPT